MTGFSTRAIHADGHLDATGDVAPPIAVSTTFAEGGPRRYRRSRHETTERFEAVIGALEGGYAVAYASGLAAAAAALDLFEPRRVALPDDVYHGVRALVEHRATAGRTDIVAPDALAAGDVLWIETPSNPKCFITDLAATARHSAERGVVTVCDATFATPALVQPLTYGIDVVMHSTTKAIAGHSDSLGGVLTVADEARAAELRALRTIGGAVPGSLDVWLALRGVRTLGLRVQAASASAHRIARWFDDRGIPVFYPGLATHPGHGIAAREMSGFGAMLSVDFGDEARAAGFVDALDIFTNATSLGGVESLAEHRIRSDPAMDPGLVRLSIGLEDVDDLIEDLTSALRSTQPGQAPDAQVS